MSDNFVCKPLEFRGRTLYGVYQKDIDALVACYTNPQMAEQTYDVFTAVGDKPDALFEALATICPYIDEMSHEHCELTNLSDLACADENEHLAFILAASSMCCGYALQVLRSWEPCKHRRVFRSRADEAAAASPAAA
jgi:hypothetical protein